MNVFIKRLSRDKLSGSRGGAWSPSQLEPERLDPNQPEPKWLEPDNA